MGMWLFWSTCGCHPAIIPKCCHSSFTLNITTTCIITFPETLFEIWNRAALVRSEPWTDLFIYLFLTPFFLYIKFGQAHELINQSLSVDALITLLG